VKQSGKKRREEYVKERKIEYGKIIDGFLKYK